MMSRRRLDLPRVPPIRKTGGAHKVKTKVLPRKAKHKKLDREVERVLDGLPRWTPVQYPKMPTNAWVYVDCVGNLNILPMDGGLLVVEEADLHVIQGDIAAFCS